MTKKEKEEILLKITCAVATGICAQRGFEDWREESIADMTLNQAVEIFIEYNKTIKKIDNF